MNKFLRNTISKLYNAVSAPVAATRDALAERLQSVRETTSLLYNRMMENMGYGQETLNDIAEKETEDEQQQEEDIDITPHEHEIALKGAYRSFVIPGRPKTNVDSYFHQTKPHIKTLIENLIKEMGSEKIIMTLWVVWKKPIKLLLKSDPEDMDDGTADNIFDEKIEIPFNSLMIQFFQGSYNNDLIERMLAYIKSQTENPKFPEIGFILVKIMHLYINFHRLVLTRGSSYTELPEWIKSKKAVINPQNKDEECFKWAVITVLYHEEIKKDHQCPSRLRPYENQYNRKGLKFPVSIKKLISLKRTTPV